MTPDHYVLARDGSVKRAASHAQPYAIVPRRRPAASASASCAPEEGGARRRSARSSSRALARVGDDLEQRLGGPQDIEWAIQGGELFVLQSRPVTT